MKQKNLYVLVGAPGSGKSTWAAAYAKEHNALHVSRDQIRFEMIKEKDGYFSKEDDVFAAFCNTITNGLKESSYTEVIADATHLNQIGRYKLLSNIDYSNANLIAVVFTTPLKTCIERNEQRSGRSVVPRSVINRMFNSMRTPLYDELQHFNEVWKVNVDGSIEKIKNDE